MEPNEVRAVLDGPVARELLARTPLTRLGYDGLDGTPRVVPVGYVWNGAQFIVCTAVNAPKVRALRARPAVALTIDTDTQRQPPHILLVRGTASVEIVDGVPDEFLATSRRSIPPEMWPEFEAQVRGLYEQMARISIEPTWAKLIDFETTLPVAVEEISRSRAAGSAKPGD